MVEILAARPDSRGGNCHNPANKVQQNQWSPFENPIPRLENPIGQKGSLAAADLSRQWGLADVLTSPRHVRFTPGQRIQVSILLSVYEYTS